MLSPKIFRQTRKKLKQRATQGSILVVILMFGLFLEAYMHNFNLVYIVLFFVFAFAWIASPVGIRNMAMLQLTPRVGNRLFAREEGTLFFELYADKQYHSYALHLKCGETDAFLPDLPPRKKETLKLPVTPEKRGMMVLNECRIESLFPLATIRFVLPAKMLPVKEELSFLVYPQPKGESLESFLAKRRGNYGEENDFDGITPDSGKTHLSRIHWPSVAKGTSAVKKFNFEIPLEHLTFDFNQAGETDEARLSQLTLWTLQCEAQQLDFIILMPNETLHSKRNTTDEILGKLAAY